MKLSIKSDGTIEFDGNDMSGIDPVKIAEIVNAMKGVQPPPKKHIGKAKGAGYVRYFEEHSREIVNDKNISIKGNEYQHLLSSDWLYTSVDTGRSDLREDSITVKAHKAFVSTFLGNENTPLTTKAIATSANKKSGVKPTTLQNVVLSMVLMGILSKTSDYPASYYLSSQFVNQ